MVSPFVSWALKLCVTPRDWGNEQISKWSGQFCTIRAMSLIPSSCCLYYDYDREYYVIITKSELKWAFGAFAAKFDCVPDTGVLHLCWERDLCHIPSWLPDGKSWLIAKDPDAGKDWGQEEKGATEDEMVGWHRWLNGHEFEQTPGDGQWQGSLARCGPWGRKVGQDLATEQQPPHPKTIGIFIWSHFPLNYWIF